MVFLTVVASLLEGLTLSLAIPLLQRLVGSGDDSLVDKGSTAQGVWGFFDRFPEDNQLQIIVASLLVLVLLKGILRFLADFSLRALMLKVGRNLRSVCIDQFLRLGLSYYNQAKGGDLLSYVNEQAQRCEQLTLYVGAIFSESIIVLSFIALLCTLSLKLTLISLTLLAIIAFSMKSIVTSVKADGKIVAATIEALSSGVFELIGGIRIIKAYTAERFEANKLDKILQRRYKAEIKAYAGQVAVLPISDTCGMIILVLLVFAATKVLDQGAMLPTLLTFLLVLLRTFPRINRLNSLRASLANVVESYQIVWDFLETTKDHKISSGWKSFDGVESTISFQSISFGYEGSRNLVLNNVDLTIPKGSMTALVGSSGSGKSTLADLLLRFYEPQSGQIKIDGIDIKEFDLTQLRQRMAVVSQETFLFNATVRDNIRYGSPEATDADINIAARQAYAEEFIQDFPDGFDTVLGDRGVRLSGGQKQRLAIARAIVRNPDILILDEATSALDSTSERLVQKALDSVSINRTVIVIAHRLSTVQQANQIVVMEKGEIIERGSHQALMSSKGYYYRLNQDQRVGIAL